MRQSYLLVLMAGLLVTGCKGIQNGSTGNNGDEAFDSETYGIEATIDVMNKAHDELADQGSTDEGNFVAADNSISVFANTPGNEPADPRIPLCGPPAIAQECRSSDDGLSFKYKEYAGCRVRGTRLILRGAVKLEFNNDSCSLDEEGKEVHRTFAVVANRILGGAASTSSAAHQNYLEEEIGGGQLLTRGPDLENGEEEPSSVDANENAATPTWAYQVLGKHVQFFNRRARKVADVSISTEGAIGIAGNRPRSPNRVVDGGTFRIDHNLAKFTARYSPENIVYEADCRCPKSGVLKASWTRGDAVKEGSIEFLGCGKIKVTKADGTVKEREIRACLKPSAVDGDPAAGE